MQRKMSVLLAMFAPYRTVQMQIAALSAFLKSRGCRVRYLENIIFTGDTFDKFKEQMREEIQSNKPDLVGFSSYDMNYSFIVDAAVFIKELSPRTKIIVGGHHASLASEDYMECPAIDYVCLGEGESVLSDLMDALESGEDVSSRQIKGLCLKAADGQPVCLKPRELTENLDLLPVIDRSIVDRQQREIDYLPVLVGKGCHFNCTYCANSNMKNLYPNHHKYVRYRSPEKIIDEIKECRKAYTFGSVYFYDDIFAFDYEWLKRFGSLYTKEFPDLPFHCLLRPEIATNEKVLTLLRDSGCRSISMGVESGSEKFRKLLLGRKMSNEVILKAASLIRKQKMDLCIYMMVGLPDESLLDMLKSLWLNFRIGPKGVQTGIYFPIKNTPLYRYCLDRRLINEEKRKRLFVYTYDTCLNYGLFKRGLIIVFKWLNSAVPLVRSFQINLLGQYVRIQYRKVFKKTIDYK